MFHPLTCRLGQSCVVVSALLLTACGLTPLHEGSQSHTQAYPPGTALDVETTNGAIAVERGSFDEVQVVAHFRMTSPERLAAVGVEVERTGDAGVMTVRVAWPDGRRHMREGCSFEITVPDATGVRLKTSNGRLATADLGGDAVLGTSNGAIEVRGHRGGVTADTSNGRVDLSGVTGAIDAKSSNGRLVIRQAGGPVKAKTSNGAIEIALAAGSTGPVDAQTSNGAVDLTLSAAFTGGLTLGTSNGGVSVEDLAGGEVVSTGKNRAELRFAQAEPTSTVRTSNGGIRVRVVDDPVASE